MAKQIPQGAPSRPSVERPDHARDRIPDPGKGLPEQAAAQARRNGFRLNTNAARRRHREEVRFQFFTVFGSDLAPS